MWKHLYDWIVENPVENGLVSIEDLDNVHYAATQEEAMKFIMEEHVKFESEDASRNTAEYLDE